MKKLLEKLKIKERTFKYISFILIIAIFIQASCIDILALDISEKIENISNIILDKTKEVNQIETIEPVIEDSKVEEVIKIYNFKQLKNVGTGNMVKNNAGVKQVYSKDSKYMLMRDIKIPKGEKWNLPDDFEGEFVENNNRKSSDNDGKDIYDEKKNAIKIYNNYQLNEIGKEDSPVMSNDGTPEEFGMGKPVYGEDSSENMTYDESNDYIISEEFTEEMPDLIANSIATSSYLLPGENPDGRTYPGQVTYNHNGKDYILIGNDSQLRAIGSNKFVTPRLYMYIHKDKIGEDEEKYIPYYPGDADLDLTAYPTHGINDKEEATIEVDGTNGYIFYKKEGVQKNDLANVEWDKEKGLVGGLISGIGGLIGGILDFILPGTHKELCGVNEQGLPDKRITESQLKGEYKNYRYSSDANYIVFRNIDCRGEDWKPLNISSNFEGRLNMEENNSPTISNISVNTIGELDPSKTIGIGFFGTISSGYDNNFMSIKSEVKNLKLDNVTVNNGYTSINNNPDSLVEGLLDGLGWLLGGLLGGLGDLIGGLLPGLNLSLGDIVRDLLSVKIASEDVFATGAFAGRITGNVTVSNCVVTNSSVSSNKSMLGGFIGYTEGTEEYDGLSKLLGGVTGLLTALLNILPGVGLGDLITVLLKNDIGLGALIPTAYHKPNIVDSSVVMSITSSTIGNENIEYVGGFVGLQKSTKVINATVSGVANVTAKGFAGGFAGGVMEDVVSGALDSLGVNLIPLDLKSEHDSCKVEGISEVKSTESYAGGYSGIIANSNISGCNVSGINKVFAAKSYCGGFTGRATVGFGAVVGADKAGDHTLLKGVGALLEKVLRDNPEKVGSLLKIAGIEPTILINSNVNGSNIEISAVENYAGGYIGQGDGVKINPKQKEESGITPQPENSEQAQTTQVQGKTTIENILSVAGVLGSDGLFGSLGLIV